MWSVDPSLVHVPVDAPDTPRPDAPVVYWRAPHYLDPENAQPGDMLYVPQLTGG